jgi:hypothetical protein
LGKVNGRGKKQFIVAVSSLEKFKAADPGGGVLRKQLF